MIYTLASECSEYKKSDKHQSPCAYIPGFEKFKALDTEGCQMHVHNDKTYHIEKYTQESQRLRKSARAQIEG
jgi:hypothetical protein